VQCLVRSKNDCAALKPARRLLTFRSTSCANRASVVTHEARPPGSSPPPAPLCLRGVVWWLRRDGAPRPERSHDMAKRNAQTSAKPRSQTKIRSKVKRAKPIVHHQTRAKSKQAAWWRC
jgi:hypothetical protein